ncbi:MAG: adenylyl-sulfate kinase [Bdellovibrionales bacterium]|nr:adenylyl-sulfate kinase [Bdellovibrionales bacterium]
MFIETATRSVAKSLSWRVLATLTTFSLVYIFTGQIETAITVGGLEVFVKMAVYYLHERGWNKLNFGRKEIRPVVVWLTGLSGSGKGRLSEKIAEWLDSKALKTERIDGPSVRKLFPELGFSRPERIGHIKRVGLLVSTLEKNGIFVVASFVSPDQDAREFVRSLCKNHIEIHIASPFDYTRNEKHRMLVERAKAGEIENFAGINEAYEEPQNPDLRIDLSNEEDEVALQKIFQLIEQRMHAG